MDCTTVAPTDKFLFVHEEDGVLKKYLRLPNTMTTWPWPRKINPHHEEVAAQSNAWFKSFNAYSPESQYAHEKCNLGLLAALTYPAASKEHLRIGTDLMHLFFAIDEYTDVEPAPVVRTIADIVMDALHNPDDPRPHGEIVLGEMFRNFWVRGSAAATTEAAKHFLASLSDFLDALVLEAEQRDNRTVFSIDSYLTVRRDNVGVRPACVIAELHLSIPDEAFYHPTMQELTSLVTDLVAVDNDIASYNREQATCNDQNNILTVAMRELRTDLDGAMRWVLDHRKQLEERFLDALDRIPSFNSFAVNAAVIEYVKDCLCNWPRANDCWSFESGRYFGSRGREYQQTRVVPLLPRRVGRSSGGVVVSLVDNLEKGEEIAVGAGTLAIAV